MAQITQDEVGALLSGQRGPLRYRYRLYRSDLGGAVYGDPVEWTTDDKDATTGTFPKAKVTFDERGERLASRPYLRDIDSGAGGTVSMSNFRDHTWELTLTRRELIGTILTNLGEYVRLFIEVYDPIGGEWLEWPFGLYKLDPYTAEHERYGSTHALTGRSPEVIVSEDSASYGYGAGAGSRILQTVRGILTARGVPASSINFPGVDKTLQTAMYFDVFQDATSVIWLRIINSLLNAGGFYALYTDATGRFTTKQIETSQRATPGVIYTSEGPHRMVVGAVSEEYDFESFANKVTVYSGDPNETVPVVGVAMNRDPNSPVSVQNLGRIVEKEPVMMQNIVSPEAAKQLAAAELKNRSSGYRRAGISVLPDPRRGPREDAMLEIRRRDGRVVFEGRWDVVNFEWPLSSPPATMKVELSRTERLTLV